MGLIKTRISPSQKDKRQSDCSVIGTLQWTGSCFLDVDLAVLKGTVIEPEYKLKREWSEATVTTHQ